MRDTCQRRPAKLPGSSRIAITVAVGCLALVSFAPTPAQAKPEWLAPVSISEEQQGAYGDKVAFDAHGDAVAVWGQLLVGGREIVQSAIRPAGGAWQSPVSLSVADEPAQDPNLAVSAGGDAVTVWQRYNGSNYVIQAAFRPADGSWQPSVDLSEAGENAYRAHVALDGRGNAVAVWERYSGTHWMVQAAFRPAGGAWQAPVDLSEPAFSAYVVAGEPRVAFDSRGDAVAVWTRKNTGTDRSVQSAIRPAAGSWQAPVNLSEEGDAAEPEVALDPRGDAVSVWRTSIPGHRDLIQSAFRPAGGSWQAPATFPETETNSNEPEVAIDPEGNAVSVWTTSIATNNVIRSAFRPSGGAWQPPVNLAESHNARQPQVAVDPQGDALAIWESIYSSVEAAVRPVGSVWQTPVDLEEAGQGGVEPDVALDSHGNAVAVWERFDDSRNEIVQAAGYDAAGPQLEGLSIPSVGTVGVPVAFAVSPLDVWSALGPTTWSFGDGSSVTGTSVTHTYAAAGSYEVTLESEDVLGNKTSTSSTIEIAPPRPTVTKVEPDSGPPGRRTSVSITGTNFTEATAIKFGEEDARNYMVNSPTSITAVSPKGKGTVDVTVTTPGGRSATSSADQFTYGHEHA